MKRSALLVIAALTLAASGCGTAKTSTSGGHTPTASTTTAAGQQATPAALEDAVRTALSGNGRLSVYVLWNNNIPSWASQSTRGPALAGLKASAVGRHKQALRVRSLSDKLQVLAVQLDPSYTSATATIHNHELVALYTNGRRNRTVTLDERDRVVLHRLGQTTQFVVWEVQPQK
jgi:hypothetical protein